LVARFGHLLALNWNIGEENTQSSEQQLAMAMNLRDTDPYGGHHIVVHTFPNGQESVYPALLGRLSPFTGASLQMAWDSAHQRTWRWVLASSQAKKPWVVANDEQGPAGLGVPPDPGYAGFSGQDAQGRDVGYTIDDIRKYTLWGNLMAGGAGVDYYFGYGLPDNDLVAENFRSRDRSWDYGRIAIGFFHSQNIRFWEMTNADGLVGNEAHDNSRYAFAKANELYLVYLPTGGTANLDLSHARSQFTVEWFDPRTGGVLRRGSVSAVKGGAPATLGSPPDNPNEDWLVVVRRN
ncbi:MAG TPA: putative collagen-binding domain-containing protein, partial [Vicinamibacterales bacterium]|nr:putative collagen-binding domain-containing protein [Vicinamibacterales bacterium]